MSVFFNDTLLAASYRYVVSRKLSKYTNNIPSQYFHYLLFYFKQDMISIIISGINHRPSIIDPFTLNMQFYGDSPRLIIQVRVVFKVLKTLTPERLKDVFYSFHVDI